MPLWFAAQGYGYLWKIEQVVFFLEQ